jgi:hypothetical protein
MGVPIARVAALRERGETHRQRVDHRSAKPAVTEHAARERLRREAVHAQCVFDDRACAADPRLLRCPANLDDVDIELGRKSAIESQLLVATATALLERGEVEEP